MNTSSAELTLFRSGRFACLRVTGRANFACSPGFQQAVEELIRSGAAPLIVDLAECRLMDSTFLGVLTGAAEKFRLANGPDASLELSNPNERVAGLLESLGVSQLFRQNHGPLELPAGVRASKPALPSPTKVQLKEVSLAAHALLMRLNPANRPKFAELTRCLQEDLDRLKAGEPPTLPGFDLAALNHQAGEVGGDFYDFAPRRGLRVGVLIADVSGKGPGAAQVAAQCRPVLQAHLATEHTPAVVFKECMQAIVPTLPPGMFVTASCLVLDSVQRSFRLARAGHDALLWFHAATRTVELLSPKGMAMGIERSGLCEATFVEKEYPLAPGDVLLLYTDGITDAVNPAHIEFGCDRLKEALKSSAPLPAKAITEKIFETVKQFAGTASQVDDQTLVVIKAV